MAGNRSGAILPDRMPVSVEATPPGTTGAFPVNPPATAIPAARAAGAASAVMTRSAEIRSGAGSRIVVIPAAGREAAAVSAATRRAVPGPIRVAVQNVGDLPPNVTAGVSGPAVAAPTHRGGAGTRTVRVALGRSPARTVTSVSTELVSVVISVHRTVLLPTTRSGAVDSAAPPGRARKGEAQRMSGDSVHAVGTTGATVDPIDRAGSTAAREPATDQADTSAAARMPVPAVPGAAAGRAAAAVSIVVRRVLKSPTFPKKSRPVTWTPRSGGIC